MVKPLSWAIVTLLLVAGGIFALRSWIGLEAGETSSSSANPEATVTATVEPSPSDSTPTPRDTPEPEPTPDSEPTPEPTPEEPRPVGPGTVSTGAAVASITGRLNAKGPDVSVWCPYRVSAAVGTRFTCAVARADAPSRVIADAYVTVIASYGEFRWRSVPR